MFTQLILSLLISFITCNIWDNIFSNLKSPHFTIPNEFKLEMSSTEGKIAEVLYSCKFNTIKFSLISNFTSILDVYLNFTEGTVSLDFIDNCTYRNITGMNTFTTKFLISSYDILTFYKMDFEPARYQYTLTNPLKSRDNNLKFLGHTIINTNKFNYKAKEPIHVFTNLFYDFYDDILDKESFIVFTVDAYKEVLSQIHLRYKGVEYKELSTNTTILNYKREDFNKRNKCSYFNNID